MPNTNTSHRKLLLDAKTQQQTRLQDAAAAADQVHAAIVALTRANSRNSTNSKRRSSALIEKITTVHDLDKEIDRQLDDDIAPNYTLMVREKDKLAASVKKTQRNLAVDPLSGNSYIDILQRRLELADQEIRILENTIELTKANLK